MVGCLEEQAVGATNWPFMLVSCFEKMKSLAPMSRGGNCTVWYGMVTVFIPANDKCQLWLEGADRGPLRSHHHPHPPVGHTGIRASEWLLSPKSASMYRMEYGVRSHQEMIVPRTVSEEATTCDVQTEST